MTLISHNRNILKQIANNTANLGGGSSSNEITLETLVVNILEGSNIIDVLALDSISDVTFFDELQNEIELTYRVLSNQIDVCSNLDISNVTIRIEGTNG